MVSDHLASFARLCPALPDPLEGRDPLDYYEASVALALARLRRSRVRLCHTCLA